MFYALELTRPLVAIGLVKMVVATIVVYFMLAPSNAFVPGLGLASTGLALKMVVIEVCGVNFSGWWLARRQGWRFTMNYQLVGIGVFMLAAFSVYHAVNFLAGEAVNVVARGSIAGMLYLVISGLILYLMPWLLGMDRCELIRILKQLGYVLVPKRIQQ